MFKSINIEEVMYKKEEENEKYRQCVNVKIWWEVFK
jgi:hypothetical protein